MYRRTVGTAFSLNPAVKRTLVKHNPSLGTSCNIQLQKDVDKNSRAVKKCVAPKSHSEKYMKSKVAARKWWVN